METAPDQVRFGPLCGLKPDILRGPRSAKTGREQMQQSARYSITSSARASRVGGTSRPNAFAVLRLMTNSYLVGACTGSVRRVGVLMSSTADDEGQAQGAGRLEQPSSHGPARS